MPTENERQSILKQKQFCYRISVYSHFDLDRYQRNQLDLNEALGACGDVWAVEMDWNAIADLESNLNGLAYQILFSSPMNKERLAEKVRISVHQFETLLTPDGSVELSAGITSSQDLLDQVAAQAALLARDLDKQVHVEVSGDRVLLDTDLASVLHMCLSQCLRNAIDHGMETSNERTAINKEAVGSVIISVTHENQGLTIQVGDDGRGIDWQDIRQRAVELGLLHADKRLNERQIKQLLFAPGFSTAEQVTEVSGRGVGMEVLWHEVRKRGGLVRVDSQLNKGTTFTITLPLPGHQERES